LSDFGVEVRYPGDMYNPNEKEALEYKQLAIEIKDFMTEKIEKLIKE